MMTESARLDIVVYVCHNCIPAEKRLPRQWRQDGAHVQIREVPCSGKTDAQYLFHAIEAGACGLLVVTCPVGQCRLSQGNYRAAIRVRTVQRLLAEIGLEARRVELIHSSVDDDIEQMVRDAVKRFCKLGESPVRTAS